MVINNFFFYASPHVTKQFEHSFKTNIIKVSCLICLKYFTCHILNFTKKCLYNVLYVQQLYRHLIMLNIFYHLKTRMSSPMDIAFWETLPCTPCMVGQCEWNFIIFHSTSSWPQCSGPPHSLMSLVGTWPSQSVIA